MTSRRSRFVSAIAWLVAVGLLCPVVAQETSSANPGINPGVDEHPIDESDRDHWSFMPLTRPSLPTVEQTDWPSTPVDCFVLSELEQNNLEPAPRAS